GISRGLLRVRVRVRRPGEKPDSVRHKLPKRVKRQAPPRYHIKETNPPRGTGVKLLFWRPKHPVFCRMSLSGLPMSCSTQKKSLSNHCRAIGRLENGSGEWLL
ncbi:hypothetical protein GQ607_009726, partial [Colletotrichum asianum]